MIDKTFYNIKFNVFYFIKFNVIESYIGGHVIFHHDYYHNSELSEIINNHLIKKSKNKLYETQATYEYSSVLYLTEEEALYFTMKGISISKGKVINAGNDKIPENKTS